MIELEPVTHNIQKYILGVLMVQRFARFRDMRPERIDTNLYSYHLKLLQKRGYVEKTREGYTLSKKGVVYIDRVTTASLDVRVQPKITTMFVIQNSKGNVLLYRRYRQPFAGRWSLPNGKLHVEDRTVFDAAQRELSEKLGLASQDFRHVGNCYIRTMDGGDVLMATFVHVFYMKTDEIVEGEYLKWVPPGGAEAYDPAPAVKQVIKRTLQDKSYFFAEFEENWRP
jgi:ADP-ribose pyrophosphatase YjhB (NUDIX family)